MFLEEELRSIESSVQLVPDKRWKMLAHIYLEYFHSLTLSISCVTTQYNVFLEGKTLSAYSSISVRLCVVGWKGMGLF